MKQVTYNIILASDAALDDIDYLQHHGVKGMKWGVRRTPEQLGHHKISKGTKLYITRPKGQDVTSGTVQFSYTEPDRARNRGTYYDRRSYFYPSKNDRKIVETTLKAREDINVPSRQELRSVVKDVALNKVKDLLTKEVNDISTEQDIPEMINFWSRKNTTADDMIDYVIDYQMILPKVQKAIIGELKNRGYNAMIDEGLLGSTQGEQQGMDPLIVFDANKTLKKVGEKKMTQSRLLDSLGRYNRWKGKAANLKEQDKDYEW